MNTIVKTTKGMLEGVIENGNAVFKGIPYAKPPVGELRFKAPQEMEAWEGIRKADTFPNMCEQELPSPDAPFTAMFYKEFYSNPDFVPPMSEDCLYLNIWTPDPEAKEKMPVAFWIHGGGFSGGYSSELEFDGTAFCRKGVVFVSIEYRLNAYGFLAHPWLTGEDENGSSGNYGILDQIAALNWVYENISAFGGDPKKITVIGQSAGSMSVQTLVSSEMTRGKIASAVMESGIYCADELRYVPDLKQSEELGEKLVKKLKVQNLEELRKVDAEHLRRARMMVEAMCWQTMGNGLVFVPNTDGYILKESVRDVWKHGGMHKIPYLLGSNANDLWMGPEDAAEGKKGPLYDENNRWAEKCQEIGAPAYRYFFSHRLPGDGSGAFHSGEIWYVHGTLDRCWRPITQEDRDLSEEMVRYWTNFMKYGCPDPEGTSWPAYTEENPFVKEFR